MRILRCLKKDDKGFTYLSLIIGVTILMIGLGFFTALFRSSRISVLKAEEQMAMATVAQNVAQVYTATGNETKAENQGSQQEYSVDLNITSGPDGFNTVTITVNSKITSDPSNPKYVEPFVLVFNTPE